MGKTRAAVLLKNQQRFYTLDWGRIPNVFCICQRI